MDLLICINKSVTCVTTCTVIMQPFMSIYFWWVLGQPFFSAWWLASPLGSREVSGSVGRGGEGILGWGRAGRRSGWGGNVVRGGKTGLLLLILSSVSGLTAHTGFHESVPVPELLQNQIAPLQGYFPYLGKGNESPLLARSWRQLPNVCRIPWQPFCCHRRPYAPGSSGMACLTLMPQSMIRLYKTPPLG